MGKGSRLVGRVASAAARRVGRTISAAVPVMVVGVVVLGAEAAYSPSARADNLWLQACSFYSEPGSGFSFSTNGTVSSWTGTDSCSTPTQEGSLQIDTPNTTGYGHYALWETVSPPGISIDSAWTPGCSGGCDRPYRGALINCLLGSYGYQAYYQWGWGAGQQRIVNNDGGGCPYSNGLADGTPINLSFAPTQQFGWYATCLSGTGWCSALGPTLYMRGVQVGATETGSPYLLAIDSNNLFYQNGRWLRGGGWPVSLAASDPSGICDLRAWLNGSLIQGPTSGLNRATWVQCSAPSPWTGPAVNTASYADGTALQLSYQADNAAGNWSTSSTSTSYVDNAPVTLTMTGPTDAPVTAGTQYITATATAGPSGIGSIVCTVDGSAWVSQTIADGGAQTATTRIPVSGLGLHQATCYAANQAIDVTGATADSPTQSWSLRIREPVAGGITFSRVSQHCRRVPERIVIRARSGVVRRGHKLRRVHRRARKERKRVTICNSTTLVSNDMYVAHGKSATVSGWFVTGGGSPLGNVPVNVMTAPDNGSSTWSTAATVTTAADVSWQTTLPPGPSRLVKAVYAG